MLKSLIFLRGVGMNRMKRSAMMLFVILVAGSIVIAGCGTGKEEKGSKESAAADVELRFAWWGSQIRHDKTIQLIAKFEETHPHIKVKPEFSGWDGYFDKLATQIAADNQPDIVQLDIDHVNEYALRGVLADLSPYAGNELQVADFDQRVLEEEGTKDGKLVGIPVGDNVGVMIYNREMYTQAGVELPKPNMTWQEYFDKAREMKGKLGDKVYGAMDMSANYEAFDYYLVAIGDSYYKDGKLGYDDGNLANWLKMWDEARQEGIVPPAAETAAHMLAGDDPTKNPLMNGNVPIYGPTWTASFPKYENVKQGIFEMVAYPREQNPGSVMLTSMFLSVSGKTKHPKESAAFIDYFLNSHEAADILGAERGLPDNKAILEYLTPKFTDTEKKMVETVKHIKSLNPSWYETAPKGSGEVNELFLQLVQKHQFGQASIEQTVADFKREGNKIFERN